MTPVPPTLPAYLSHITHAGLYSAVNITTGGSKKTNPAILGLYKSIMDSLFPDRTHHVGGSDGRAADPKVEKELYEQRAAASVELHKYLIIPLDETSSINNQAIHERECHESMLQKLQPYLARGLATLTPADIEGMLKEMHTHLFVGGHPEIPCPGAYRTESVVVYKYKDGERLFDRLTNPAFMLPYLAKHEPQSLPILNSLLPKMMLWSKGKDAFAVGDFYHSAGLTQKEKAFLLRYVELRTAHHKDIPGAIQLLSEQLVILLKCGQDPITIASMAHMELVKIHPFCDGNGRIARAMMNMLLVNAGLSPVVFTSHQEYEKAVEEARDGKKSFEDLVRQKVEKNTGKDPAILEAELNAMAIQSVWRKLPEGSQRAAVTEFLNRTKLLLAPQK